MPKTTETGDGKRLDAGKARLELVPRMPLWLAAEAYGVGADKYERLGWRRNPMEWSRVRSAADRHMDKWWELGETHDQTDGQHHLGAVLFGILTLAEYERLGIGEDDRPFR